MVCGNSALNSAEEQEHDDSIHSPQTSTEMSPPQTVIVWHFVLPSYTSVVFYHVTLVISIIALQIVEFCYFLKIGSISTHYNMTVKIHMNSSLLYPQHLEYCPRRVVSLKIFIKEMNEDDTSHPTTFQFIHDTWVGKSKFTLAGKCDRIYFCILFITVFFIYIKTIQLISPTPVLHTKGELQKSKWKNTKEKSINFYSS